MRRHLFFERGETYEISVEFVSEQRNVITLIQPNLVGMYRSNWKKMPGLKNEILEEPLQRGDMYTFKMPFPVKKAYPRVSFYSISKLLIQALLSVTTNAFTDFP